MSTYRTIPQIIDAFGGATAFSRAIGVKPTTASEMKRRGTIPGVHWKRIVSADPIEGDRVSYEELAEAHAKEVAA